MEKYKETKNRQRKRYYNKTAFLYPYREWTNAEDQLVLAHTMPDNELSGRIKRSVAAIQKRRWWLKNIN